ncbi:hypothetical protein NPIL_242451, partial [Nephila pilipes]
VVVITYVALKLPNITQFELVVKLLSDKLVKALVVSISSGLILREGLGLGVAKGLRLWTWKRY